MVTRGEPYDVVVNGDVVDGAPYNSTAQMSANPSDQERIAIACLEPIVKRLHSVGGSLFMIRGTETHVGKSAADEERIARALGAKPDKTGHYARWDLWKRVGEGLVHILHHIGVTSSSAHEASAVNAELTAAYYEAARTGKQPPDVIIRSHRHRAIKVDVPVHTKRHGVQFASAVTTPGWQLKTPFSWRIAGARQTLPQIGGLLVRQGDRSLYTEFRVWSIERSETEV